MSGLFKVAGISTALRVGWVIPEKTFVYDFGLKKYFFGDGVTVGGKTFEALSASDIVALLNGLTGANRLSSDSLREGTVKNFYTRVASTTALTSLTGEIPIAFVTENNTWYKYDASSTATPDGVLIAEVTAGGRFIAFAGDKFLFDDAKKLKTSFLPDLAIMETIEATSNTLQGFIDTELANKPVQKGDIVVITDTNASINLWRLKADDATKIENYQKIDSSKIAWGNLLDKPTSSVVEIDASVAKTNKIVQYSLNDLFVEDTASVANVYVVKRANSDLDSITAYVNGTSFKVKITNTNTGASTLKIGSLSAVGIVDVNGSALVGGELVSGKTYDFSYDGTNFVVKLGFANLDTAKAGVNATQQINPLVLKGFMSSVLNGFEPTGRLALYEDSLALLNYNCDKSLSASTTDVPTDFIGIGDCSTRIGANSNDDRRQIIYGKASQSGYIWYRSTTDGVYGAWSRVDGIASFAERLKGFEPTGLHTAYTGDLNDIVVNSKYHITATTTNTPTDFGGNGFCSTDVSSVSTEKMTQIILGAGTQSGYIWYRVKTSNAWENWIRVDGIGIGQTWQNVTASRVAGTTYTNTTGKGFFIVTRGTVNNTASSRSIKIDGDILGYSQGAEVSAVTYTEIAYVPSGAEYLVEITGSAGIEAWIELRS